MLITRRQWFQYSSKCYLPAGALPLHTVGQSQPELLARDLGPCSLTVLGTDLLLYVESGLDSKDMAVELMLVVVLASHNVPRISSGPVIKHEHSVKQE